MTSNLFDIQKQSMEFASLLLNTLVLSQFDQRHLQFWEALLSQNPHIFS